MQALKRYGDAHSDRQAVDPLVVPCLIVANKYDVFVKTVEPEKQKWIGRFLRWLAHRYGATLMYASMNQKEEGTLAVKHMFQHLVFKTAPPLTAVEQDPARRLFVPVGADRYVDMDIPSLILKQVGNDLRRLTLEHWKADLEHFFPATNSPSTTFTSVELSKYPEKAVDELLAKLI
jgi:hypothetical protein